MYLGLVFIPQFIICTKSFFGLVQFSFFSFYHLKPTNIKYLNLLHVLSFFLETHQYLAKKFSKIF